MIEKRPRFFVPPPPPPWPMETETTGDESETEENAQDMFAVHHHKKYIGELPPLG